MGSYSDALTEFTRSFELYQEIGEIGDMALQYRRIGRIYYLRLGRYEKARKSFFAALASYQDLADRKGEAETLYEIGLTYEKMGLFEEADDYYQKGKRIGEELDDSFPDGFRASLFGQHGMVSGAITRMPLNCSPMLTNCPKNPEIPNWRLWSKNTRGLIYWTLNDTDKGLTHLKTSGGSR